MKKTKAQKGITLIALIITIIVLLILAVVAVRAVTGDGIIVQALSARESHFKAQAQEEVQLALNDLKIESSIKDIDEVAYLQAKLGEGATVEQNGKGNFTIIYKGYEVVVENYGIVSVQGTEQDNNGGSNNGNNGGTEDDGTGVDWDTVIANAQRHPEQDANIPEIGIDMYGNAVNLNYWCYEFNEADKTFATGQGVGSRPQVGYKGTISPEGEIIGEIPQYIIKDNQKYTLTSLARAFTGLASLKKSPEIPNTVISLGGVEGQGAFEKCKDLEVVSKIPNSVTDMSYTFKYCTSLTTVPTIPNSVTNMKRTFYGCTSLVIAPEILSSATSWYYTFSGCTSLTTVPTIPNSVTDMSYTFNNCTSLTTVATIPNSVTNMSYTFNNCTSLITAPEIQASNLESMPYTFYGCTKLTTVPKIPESVTSLYTTFKNCTSLITAPKIPESVTDLSHTFYGCTSLITVPAIPNSVTQMASTFNGCTSLATAPTIPNSVINMICTFYNCNSLTGNLIINANNVSEYSECLNQAATNNGCNLIVSGTCPQLDEIIATKDDRFSHITKGN